MHPSFVIILKRNNTYTNAYTYIHKYMHLYIRIRISFRILAKGVKMRYNGILGAMWYDPPGSKLGDPGIYSVIRST